MKKAKTIMNQNNPQGDHAHSESPEDFEKRIEERLKQRLNSIGLSNDIQSNKASGNQENIEEYSEFRIPNSELESKSRENSERRRSPDWITRGVTLVTVLGWLCAVVAIVLLELARPAGESLFAGLLDSSRVSPWDVSTLIMAYSAIMLSLVTSVLGLIFNTVRLRRKADRFSRLLIVLCGVSALLVVFFLVSYSRYL